MAKRGSGRKSAAKAVDYTTYCIRLNPREKAVLERAIGHLGWTPTNFVRKATLEKALFVTNTNEPTTFDFNRLARDLAAQLCSEAAVRIGSDDDPDGALIELGAYLERDRLFSITDPPPLNLQSVEQVRLAARLGGTEFLGKVLEECERLVSHQRKDLPPPIDPSDLGSTE